MSHEMDLLKRIVKANHEIDDLIAERAKTNDALTKKRKSLREMLSEGDQVASGQQPLLRDNEIPKTKDELAAKRKSKAKKKKP